MKFLRKKCKIASVCLRRKRKKVTKVAFERRHSWRAPKNWLKLGEMLQKDAFTYIEWIAFLLSLLLHFPHESGSDSCFQVILAEPHFYVRRRLYKIIVTNKVKTFPSSNALAVVCAFKCKTLKGWAANWGRKLPPNIITYPFFCTWWKQTRQHSPLIKEISPRQHFCSWSTLS